MDLRQKFGLFSIGTKPVPEVVPSANPSPELDRAVALYSGRILDLLSSAPDRQMTVQNILQACMNAGTDVPTYEEFLALIQRLEGLNLVRIIQRDPFGNHLVAKV